MEVDPDGAHDHDEDHEPREDHGAASTSDEIALALPEDVPGLGEEISEVAESSARRDERRALAARLQELDAPSAMLTTFGFVLRWLSSFLFAHVLLEKRSRDVLQDAASRGHVVYVMQSRSLLDYLYFNWAFREHDLPLAAFANGLKTTWLRGVFAWIGSWFGRPKASEEEQFEALVTHGDATFLFLERPRASEAQNIEYSQRFLFRAVRTQRRAEDRAVLFMPLLLLWERRPDPHHVSFLHDIFGTGRAPGLFRKIFGVFQTVWQSFFNIGRPMVQTCGALDLRQLLREYPGAGSAEGSEILRDRLMEAIEQERQVILGPTGQPPESLRRIIMHRPEIIEGIQRVAKEEEVSEESVKRRAQGFFKEIAANQSLLVIKIFSLFLSLVWYRIYDGFEVDEEGLEAVREKGKTHSLILIPSHKSHVDYLILSYLFYHYGLIPPHIAAGVNLSFFPLGWLFRHCGAFFIRRTFKGEKLYPMVFREYLIQLMRQGYPIEFFIEGTRSRTGKLVKPRYGVLEMILSAFASGRIDSVAIVPISVGYEKVIESTSHRREVLGGEKKREGLTELLKTPKVLTSKYGRLYVQFGDPIDLGEYLDRYDVSRLQPGADALKELTVRLGHRVIYDINHVTTVTPTALAATVLLNAPTRNVARERFVQEAGFVLRFLTEPERDARLSGALERALEPVMQRDLEQEPDVEVAMGTAAADVLDEALGLLARDDHLNVLEEAGEVFYKIEQEGRPEIAYARNTIIHLFVPEALLSCAALTFQARTIAYTDLKEETHFLSKLFKYEWIYEERAAFTNVFDRTLHYFARTGWLTIDGIGEAREVTLTTERPVELGYLRRLMLSFLEAYALMATFLPELTEGRERGALIKDALKRGKAAYLGGELLYYESLSKPTLTNALRLFEDWGIIARKETDETRRDPIYVLTEDALKTDEHLTLRAHLEGLVYHGDRPDSPRLARDT